MGTVLVIEDNEAQSRLYSQELTDAGHHVVVAGEGLRALKLLRSGNVKPDVVVLDIVLSDIDGVELLDLILAHDRELPVILNTAYNLYRKDFMTWAAAAYVIKSADLSELKAAIGKALEKENE